MPPAPPSTNSSPRPSPLAPVFVPAHTHTHTHTKPPGAANPHSKPTNRPADGPLPPSAIPCRYFNAGYCSRGRKCWYLHDVNQQQKARAASRAAGDGSAARTDDGGKEECAICYDAPETYGLMTGCDHVFCLDCIRAWRATTSSAQPPSQDSYDDDPNALGQTCKNCPLCRLRTKYIIPSVVYPKPPADGSENVVKKQIIEVYLHRLSKLPCRYFTNSLRQPLGEDRTGPHGRPPRPHCPFGNDCHYRHEMDGEKYTFDDRELARHRWLHKAAVRRRRVHDARSRSLWPAHISELAAHAVMIQDALRGDGVDDDDEDDDDDDDDEDDDDDAYFEYGEWEFEDQMQEEQEAAMAFLLGSFDDGTMFEFM